MMDRKNMTRQRGKVARLSIGLLRNKREIQLTKERLERSTDAIGSWQGLTGAFLVGGLIGLKTAPSKSDRNESKDGARSTEGPRNQHSASSDLLRWVNAGLLLWRLQFAADSEE